MSLGASGSARRTGARFSARPYRWFTPDPAATVKALPLEADRCMQMTETRDESGEYPPPRNKPIWVQCEGFRCLAIMEDNGKWKTVFGSRELTGTITVIADLSVNHLP